MMIAGATDLQADFCRAASDCIEESRGDQGGIDRAQTPERQIGQASAHAVADHQRAGESGRGDRHAQHHGDVDAAEVAEVAKNRVSPKRVIKR